MTSTQQLPDGRWVDAVPLPEPWLWRLWRFLSVGDFKHAAGLLPVKEGDDRP